METRSRKRSQPDTAQQEPPGSKRSTRSSTRQAKPSKDKSKAEEAPQQPPAVPSAAPVPRGRRSARSNGRGSARRAAQAGSPPPQAPAPEVPAAPDLPAPEQEQVEKEVAKPAEQPQQQPEADMAGRGRHDDEGEDMARNLSSASNALQGLLRKLGAGFDDAFMAMGGMSGSRFKSTIADLRQAEDEGAQLAALTELCELLSISSEDNLTAFPVESGVPLLVNCLNMEHNPDIMLLAARALTFLADMMPSACSSIVRHGAVSSFCQRLLTIEYIDVAEQSLLALEKLSHDHAHALLQQGGLLAVLSYLDFFPTGVQRVAVGTAASMCRGLTSENASAVQEAIPILTNLLQYQDAKVVDSACLALSNIADSYANKPQLLAMLSNGGLITQALQMVSLTESGNSSSQLSLGTYYSMVKLLAACSAKSPAVAQQLLEGQLLPILHTLLATSALLPTSAAGSNSHAMLRTPDQLYEVMSLLCELLPPVSSATAALMEDAAGPAQAGPSSNGKAGSDERSAYFEANPDATRIAVQQLVPLMLQLHSSTVMPHVRQQCLTTLLRLLALASPAMLQEGLRSVPLSSFMAGVLGSRDTYTQAVGLQMCDILMAKLPSLYKSYFLKEGVVQALQQLAAKAPAPASAVPAAAAAAATTPAVGAAPEQVASPGEAPKTAAQPDERRRVTRSSSRQRDASNSGKEGGTATAAAATTSTRAASPSSRRPPMSPSSSGRARGGSPNNKQQEPAPAAAEPRPAAAAAAATATDKAPAGPTEGGAPTLATRLAQRAAAFCAQHFGECAPGSAAMETAGMQRLRSAGARLRSQPAAVQELLQLLSAAGGASEDGAAPVAADGEETISAYELLNSGVVQVLADYLQGTDLSKDVDSTLLGRLRSFVQLALTADSGEQPPLVAVLRKLQAALASSETFPVLLSRMQCVGMGRGGMMSQGAGRAGLSLGGGPSSLSNSMGSYRNGLAALSRPFKLRLSRHSTERNLRDYGSNVVLIEPLASMTTIEDFLYPRVCQPVSVSSMLASVRSEQPATEAAAAGGGGTAAGGSKADGAGSKPGSSSAPEPGGSKAALLPPTAEPAAGSSRQAAPAAKAGAPANMPPPSAAQPIPDDKSNRRTTRAAAARANAAAAAAVAEPVQAGQDAEGDVVMRGQEPAAEHEDEEMEEAFGEEEARAHEGLPPYYDDEGEEEYDEELEGEEDDGDMDIGNMQVHDLHVEEPAAGAAAGGPAPDLPRTRSSPAPKQAPAAAPWAASQPQTKLASTNSEPPSAWGGAGKANGAAAGAAAGSRGTGAAAAAGGAATAAGARDSAVMAEQPRLVFYSGTQKLSSSSTVFQAIQQLALSRGGGSSGGSSSMGDAAGEGGADAGSDRPLWDGIYTLHYRAADASDAVPSTSAAPAAAEGQQGAAEVFGPMSTAVAVGGLPLGAVAHLQAIKGVVLPAELTAEAGCAQVMRLIKVLEAVNRHGARLCYAAEAEEEAAQPRTSGSGRSKAASCCVRDAEPGDRPVYGRAPRSELVCNKLNSKLSQQLKDVLSICGGGIPAWCKQLVFGCRHLFTFEIRRRYFYCTALGLGRALQHMQALHASEVGGAAAAGGSAAEREAREMRVGRLQRQKVRVSRKRILESAIKVMELYASQRAVLELEYFGEVGTGLGPTLEFYTLLSHDLQRRSLAMWRHEDAATPGAMRDEAPGLAKQPSVAAGAAVGEAGGVALPGAVLGPIAAVARETLAQGKRPAFALHTQVEAWHDDTQFVNAPWGLFPSPLAATQRASGRVLDLFKLLGRAMAKALQDNRLMDLPLNYTFYRAVQGSPLDLYDIASFDPVLGQQLQKLWVALLAARKAAGAQQAALAAPAPRATRRRGSASGKQDAKQQQQAGSAAVKVVVDGVPVEDLCLTYTLPGYPEYELVAGGADVVVDSTNLGQWIQAVVDATLGEGIAAQLAAFKAGFNEVFPLSHLDCFYEDEIEALLCGTGEHWDVASLSKAIKFDHGYTVCSPVVVALLEVLAELDAHDQRRFLRFVTGCPRLPAGGLASLQPRLTVVRKHPSTDKGGSLGSTPVGSLRASNDAHPLGAGTSAADGDLPSVMTCANYIKLPPYSSKEVLRERLLYAIREGQGSFDLS